MEISALMEALADPAAYPYPVTDIEVRQTHISAVFLTGDFVYKFKKPVDLGFLDFSTLQKRRHFCDEEVRLNRRLAPDVYLGVVPIVQSATGCHFEGEGDAIEWAVKMRRLPDAVTFLERLERGELGVEHVEALARRIATFHRVAETNSGIAAFGRIDGVSRIVLNIFDQAVAQVGITVSERVYTRVKELAKRSLIDLAPLINRRSAQSMTRDCHGDLHLDHVYLFPDHEPPADLVIIDCIEFCERFRFIDPVADMAFPMMDLLFHGRKDLASSFRDGYFRASGDDEGRLLLPLYTAYRATVRGMVEGLLLAEKEANEEDRFAALRRARAHWLLALTELEIPGQRPCLILVAGLPGTGKSVVARGLAESGDFVVIRSDVVRKELAGLPIVGSVSEPTRERIYTTEWNDRTYAECLRRAESLLFEGQRVIVDANFREEKYRQNFLTAVAQWGVPSHILLCHADPETVRQRLAQRHDDASDADWSVYANAAEKWEPVGPSISRLLHTISTDGTAEQSVSNAFDVLKRVGLLE